MIWAAVGMAIASLQGGPLPLDEAIRLATENAFAVRQAETAIEKTRNQISIAKGGLGPKLTLDATYTRFDQASTANFGGQTVVVSPIDSKQARASLTWQVDLAGNVGRAIKAADAVNSAAEAQRDAQINDVKQRVRQGYHGVLLANELLTVAEQARKNNLERLKNAEAQLAGGVVARVDVLRFETQVAQTEADVLASENRVRLAKQSLNNVIGRAIETPFEVVAITTLPDTAKAPEGYIAEAMQTRPDVVAQTRNLEALRYARLAEQRGLSPTLNFSAVHQRNIDAQGLGSRDGSTTGSAVISWPVFDSGITRSRINAAKRDEEQAETALDQIRLGISLEVRQALSNLSDARARLTVSKKQVELARESYRLSQIRYEAGEGIQLEITDAQTELTRALSGEVTARYDTLNAYAALQRATGKDAPEGKVATEGEGN